MENEMDTPEYSCGNCGKPVAHDELAYWIDDDLVYCSNCGLKVKKLYW